VELSDTLSARLRLRKKGLLTNGEELSHARRDKYLMGERIRAAGLRAARQVEAGAWADVESFAQELYGEDGVGTRLKLVLKPCRSAGTDNVFFVSTLGEARRAFDAIVGDTNIFGERNETVLVQEFLQVSSREFVLLLVFRGGNVCVCGGVKGWGLGGGAGDRGSVWLCVCALAGMPGG
jgi:biotin carboxylase